VEVEVEEITSDEPKSIHAPGSTHYLLETIGQVKKSLTDIVQKGLHPPFSFICSLNILNEAKTKANVFFFQVGIKANLPMMW
jgi:hypothetical protein